MKNTAVLALATMLGVGYLVFRAGGVSAVPSSGVSAVPSSGGSFGSVSGSGGYTGGGGPRATLSFAPSGGANPITEPSGLPEWFIRSVETPLPKRFVGAIYSHQIAALRDRGY